ncbi:uncharacterized protein BO66DRAFT_211971 [Aspergillus aculeatinus CBS 121060]|uniref:Uncharacterized protein n=1 Tax=Aspergillus aculeatinus CBS 121060 TaxID=1448322 RepID=A0ACD1GVZ7_9EURO|nr:hypothetical protein BO66DRAFT_211971 [Aspergillus aculeatinus CBS 121060]RAH65377.1 hypothetical protein BO66DRAFT_211971 [Aspergillus aculeatinus CBS 121060]
MRRLLRAMTMTTISITILLQRDRAVILDRLPLRSEQTSPHILPVRASNGCMPAGKRDCCMHFTASDKAALSLEDWASSSYCAWNASDISGRCYIPPTTHPPGE